MTDILVYLNNSTAASKPSDLLGLKHLTAGMLIQYEENDIQLVNTFVSILEQYTQANKIINKDLPYLGLLFKQSFYKRNFKLMHNLSKEVASALKELLDFFNKLYTERSREGYVPQYENEASVEKIAEGVKTTSNNLALAIRLKEAIDSIEGKYKIYATKGIKIVYKQLDLILKEIDKQLDASFISNQPNNSQPKPTTNDDINKALSGIKPKFQSDL